MTLLSALIYQANNRREVLMALSKTMEERAEK